MKMFCYIIAGCPKVTTSMNMHQSIQHLQPCDSWGPSNHRSHDQFAVSFVPDCSGSGPVSTLFSSSMHAAEALSIFSSCSSSFSKDLASCSSRLSSACTLCLPLKSLAAVKE
uniref:Guanine nucleotide-binding protein subunit gamma 2 isoform X1 n=1 Tax=Rhizophora mucronata TaxID=61149 RepID=A0A2P2LZ87_RHIMU